MADIAPDKLSTCLEEDNEGLVVLDIRRPEDFDGWRIPGSTNIDVLDELKNDLDGAEDALADLLEDEGNITVCGDGVVSRTATPSKHPPNFQRVKRVNFGLEDVVGSVPSALEVPNRCAAE